MLQETNHHIEEDKKKSQQALKAQHIYIYLALHTAYLHVPKIKQLFHGVYNDDVQGGLQVTNI